jgi:uncharacterized membrane protein YbhN (UPF0104 family)
VSQQHRRGYAAGLPRGRAVVLFRVATFWLSIPAGSVAYLLLRWRGVVCRPTGEGLRPREFASAA